MGDAEDEKKVQGEYAGRRWRLAGKKFFQVYRCAIDKPAQSDRLRVRIVRGRRSRVSGFVVSKPHQRATVRIVQTWPPGGGFSFVAPKPAQSDRVRTWPPGVGFCVLKA